MAARPPPMELIPTVYPNGPIPAVYLPLLKALMDFFASEQSDGLIYEHQIRDLRNHGCNPGVARPGLKWFASTSFLEELTTKDQGQSVRAWQLTSEGAVAFHAIIKRGNDPEANWTPLELDRDQAAFTDAVTAVNDLSDRVRGDNELATREPLIHRSLSDSLVSGLALLKNRVITRIQMRALLIDPATWIAGQFARTAIGELAEHVINILVGFM